MILFTLQVFAGKITLIQLMDRNWNISKANIPAVVALEKQLQIKQSELDTASTKHQDNAKTKRLTSQANGGNYSSMQWDKYIIAESNRLMQMQKEVDAIKAKISLHRLTYEKQNRKSFADWLAKQPN